MQSFFFQSHILVLYPPVNCKYVYPSGIVGDTQCQDTKQASFLPCHSWTIAWVITIIFFVFPFSSLNTFRYIKKWIPLETITDVNRLSSSKYSSALLKKNDSHMDGFKNKCQVLCWATDKDGAEELYHLLKLHLSFNCSQIFVIIVKAISKSLPSVALLRVCNWQANRT